MQNFLSKLTPITSGSWKQWLTRGRMNAIQDAIKALAAGDNIATTGELRRAHGVGGISLGVRRQRLERRVGRRFPVTYDAVNQRLYVGVGGVFSAKTGEDHQSVKSFFPTLDSKSLVDLPYWDVSDKDPDTAYNVWCLVDQYYAAKMVLEKDEETLEFELNENAYLIATITWKSEGGKLVVDDLTQFWESDIPQFYGSGDTHSDSGGSESSGSDSGSSGSSGSSGGSSGSSGGSSGGGDPDSESDGSDSNSSDSSSSSCSCSFPGIVSFTVELSKVGSSFDTSCIPEDATNTPVYRSCTAKVKATLSGGVCDDCAGFVDIIFQVGGRSKSQNVGSNELGGSPDYEDDIVFNGFPCAEYTAKVWLAARSSGSAADSCCLTGSGPKTTATLTMPGTCSNLGACD